MGYADLDLVLVSLRLPPALTHRIAQAMKREGVTSRPTWMKAALEVALAESEALQ